MSEYLFWLFTGYFTTEKGDKYAMLEGLEFHQKEYLMKVSDHEKIVADLKAQNSPTKTPLSLDEFDESALREIIGEWKMYWMNQRQNSEADFQNYYSRAFGVDANMQHSLARMLNEKLRPVIQELRAEVAELKNKFIGHEDCRETSKGWHECMRNMETEIQTLKAEKAELTKALEFYANEFDVTKGGAWIGGPLYKDKVHGNDMSSVRPGFSIGGKLAREVLNKQRGE